MANKKLVTASIKSEDQVRDIFTIILGKRIFNCSQLSLLNIRLYGIQYKIS